MHSTIPILPLAGATGLHLAIAYGNDEVAEQLIACGASPYQRARYIVE